MYQILVVDDERIERNGIKMQLHVRLLRLQMEEMRLSI